ncbi:MAG: hypothetical protein A2Y38_20310 [Spirochaetes bacterium GWB1_59_5]|nr:MAG: hypothetical protein A2Y38_20310 [Spirochaetes bacterium GWB1_59_5]
MNDDVTKVLDLLTSHAMVVEIDGVVVESGEGSVLSALALETKRLRHLRDEVAAAAKDSMWYAREPRILKALAALDETP